MNEINQIRVYKIQAIYSTVLPHYDEHKENAQNFAIYVEYIIYNYVQNLKSNHAISYHTYVDSVIGLFSAKDDFAYLCQQLGSNSITYVDLIESSIIKLLPHKYKKQIARLDQKYGEVKITTLFKCSRCKKNRCTTRPIQLRRSDEGTSTNITCVECDYNWTING